MSCISLFLFLFLLACSESFIRTEAVEMQAQRHTPGKTPPPGQLRLLQGRKDIPHLPLLPVRHWEHKTRAILMLNSFEKGKDDGGLSECNGEYHSVDTPVVALWTGWFNNMKSCLKCVTLNSNRRSVKAMVVDECDSTEDCNSMHDFQPTCQNNIVDASKAVWKAFQIPQGQWGWLDVTWSDA